MLWVQDSLESRLEIRLDLARTIKLPRTRQHSCCQTQASRKIVKHQAFRRIIATSEECRFFSISSVVLSADTLA